MVDDAVTGPDDLATVTRQRDAAIQRARDLEHEVGRLRGQVARLEALSSWRRAWRRAGRIAVSRAGRVFERSR
jgi:hypothetical protein